jgi:integrase
MSQSVSQQRHEINFLNSIRTETTRKYYQFYFNKYSEFVKGNLLGENRIIEGQIIDFLLSLKNKGLTFDSIRCYFFGIAHFYIMNDIIINRKKIIKFIDTDERKKHKNTGYTTEQIHKLLDICDERTKAIILLYASSGIRLGALPQLKIRDLETSNSGYTRITVYQGYKEEYITFCTPECNKVINSYLSYRQRCGEELKPDAPLIREQFDASDPFKVKYPKHISIKTIAKTLRLKAIQAGLIKVYHIGTRDGSKYRKDIPLIHGFRKFFNTALMNADLHHSFKELLMGHTIKLDDVYYDKNSKKSQAKLLEEYCKGIPYLTINPTDEENERLKSQITKMEHESQEWKEIKQMVFDMKNSMSASKAS